MRGFADRAVEEYSIYREHLDGISFELEQANPIETEVSSAWVDGSSTFIDLTGGSLYVVRAAAGLFRPNEPIIWRERMSTGFTTLPRHVDRLVGIQRNILEIECIIELLAESPEYLVLDNGLASYATQGVPHSTLNYFSNPIPDDRPEFEYFESFVRFMRRFDVLIQQSQILGVPLIGAAKDPRSRIFTRSLGLSNRLNDASAISMLARNRVGFTQPIQAKYLEEPRVNNYLTDHSILTDGRGDFLTLFTILSPHSRVFRLDYLQSQAEMKERIQSFAVSMHDGNGYLIPSHIVHNKATISHDLSDRLLNIIISSIAREDMEVARFIFNQQRRSNFG